MGDVSLDTSVAAPAAQKGHFWPVFIIALLAAQVLLAGVCVLIATSDRSFAVEPDYYRKALRWDEHRAQLQHDSELGWQAALEVAPDMTPTGARRVVVRLTGRDGAPLDGACVRLTSFHHARADDRTETELHAETNGAYGAGVPLRRAGLWEFRFTVERAGQTFTAVESRELAAGRRSP